MPSKSRYSIYLLLCSDKSLYCGITTDVKRRFKEHKAGKGGAYTRAHKVVKIVYTEKAKDRSSALKREAAIKRMTREEKLELIKNYKNYKKKNVKKVCLRRARSRVRV